MIWRQLFCIFNILVLIFDTALAAANENTVIMKKTAQMFHQVMGQCAERTWPGYNLNKLKVVLVAPSEENQWVIDVANNKNETIPTKDLPMSAIRSTFSFFKINDQQFMSLEFESFIEMFLRHDPTYLENLPSMIFGLGVHEAFHFLGQKDWKKSSGPRGTELPILAEPRYLRAMLFENLKQAFLKPQKMETYLGRAAYWYQQWSTKYPHEQKSTTDGYEGSARFVEVVANALAEVGCQASEEQLQSRLRQKIQEGQILEFGSNFQQLDQEGYPIGGMASLLLRFNPLVENWSFGLKNNQTPVEILLNLYSPLYEGDDTVRKKSYENQARLQQQEADKLLGTTLAQLTDHQTIYVDIPYTWREGSYSPQGFFVDRKLNVQLFPLAMNHDFQDPTNPAKKMTAIKDAVVVSPFGGSPCQMGGFTFVLSPKDISNQDDLYKFNSKHIKGTAHADKKTDHQNRHWLCLR